MAENEPSAQSPSEYIPFNMDCRRCEYEPVCWLPLKVVNKITRRWIRFCRQDAGMGEKEYGVFLNGVFCCQTEHEITAREIVGAMLRSTRTRWIDEVLNEGDGVYRP